MRSTRTAGREERRAVSLPRCRFTLYIAGGWLLPGRRRIVPYSIQTLKRLKPAWGSTHGHDEVASRGNMG